MMERWMFFTIFAISLSCVLCEDALILMETKGEVDINAMKSILPTVTKQLYKIKVVPGQNTTDWKYAVLARDVTDTATQKAYVTEVEELAFVKSTKTYRIQPDSPIKIAFLNLMIKAAKFIGTISGTLPPRPLKPFTPPWSTCDALVVEAPSGSDIFSFSLQKYGDMDALARYGKMMMLKVLPALGVQMTYNGAPDSEEWDNLTFQNWGKKEVFCEWALSTIAMENGRDFMKAYPKNLAFSAVQI